jgi:hypothetical protein
MDGRNSLGPWLLGLIAVCAGCGTGGGSRDGTKQAPKYFADQVYPYNKASGTLRARVEAVGATTIELFSVDQFNMVSSAGDRLLFAGAQVQRVKGGVCMILYGKVDAKHDGATLQAEVTFNDDRLRLTYTFKKVDGKWPPPTGKVEKIEEPQDRGE